MRKKELKEQKKKQKTKTEAGLSHEPPFKKDVLKYVRVFDNEHLF